MKNIYIALIAAAALFLVLQRSGCINQGPGAQQPDTTIVRDTLWHESQKIVIREMQPIEVDNSYVPTEEKYQASKDMDSLIRKFDSLVKELTARNIYRDSLKLDSVGYVVVKDTVQFNKLQNRGYEYKYRIPQVNTTTTITKYAPAKGQLYIGGAVELFKSGDFNQVNGGLLYKNKKDQIYGGYVGYDPQGQLSFGVQTYWKIKLKK